MCVAVGRYLPAATFARRTDGIRRDSPGGRALTPDPRRRRDPPDRHPRWRLAPCLCSRRSRLYGAGQPAGCPKLAGRPCRVPIKTDQISEAAPRPGANLQFHRPPRAHTGQGRQRSLITDSGHEASWPASPAAGRSEKNCCAVGRLRSGGCSGMSFTTDDFVRSRSTSSADEVYVYEPSRGSQLSAWSATPKKPAVQSMG